MMGGRTLRIILIAGALILTGIIYLLPKVPEKEKSAEKKEADIPLAFSFEKFSDDAKTRLEWNASNRISTWEELLETNANQLSLYDSIGSVWDSVGNPGMAASLFERKAIITQLEKDWLNAAYRYFDAFKASKDSAEVQYFVRQAMNGYSKVLEINPGNLDAKMDLGVLYAEGTTDAMKGIMMLREVVTENPFHENAQLNLGFLSMKSGQFDKAVERFQKVLEINPSRIDMYVYIGEAYVRTGDKEKAIENFEVFKNLANDPQMISDVDEYIAALKNK
jgi:tetratricopeptide (TPR) repeat protein